MAAGDVIGRIRSVTVDVVTKYGEFIDTTTMVGIEIGALHSPRLPRDDPNVRYLDHATKEELRAKYADNPQAAPRADDLVEVDYIWEPGLRLIDVLGEDAPIDFVIASHLLEHIPNPLGWLQQVEEILDEGGILALVLPDKRYCFDARRPVTTLSQVTDAWLRDRQFATFQQIYDHEANFLGDVAAADLWAGLDPRSLRRTDVDDADVFALNRCREIMETGEYQDVHCSTFTPESFGEIFTTVVRLGLLNFEMLRLYPTEANDYEFFVTLRKRDLRDDVTRARSLAEATRMLEAADGFGREPPGHRLMAVSEAEARTVEAKRRVLGAVRTTLATIAATVRGSTRSNPPT
jgi:SAM-dependent methyltransferase